MMASSRSSSVRPRDAIGSLCQLMRLKGITGLTPEIFRQAKFNKPEAVAPLWSLLTTLTHYSTNKCIASKVSASSHQATPSSTVSSVKHAVWAAGYRCYRFHCLPEDMSGGSRELLLACGWLLAKTDTLVHLMIDNKAQSADTEHLHLEEVHHAIKKKEEFLREKNASIGEENGDSHRAKYLAWQVGRCRMALRRLYLQQQELWTIAHQIHAATQGVSMSVDSPHLSSLQTFVIRHAEQLKKYQQMLEAEQSRLHVCLKWQEQQATFWQWMESVLDARLEDSSNEASTPDDSNIPSPVPRAEDLPNLVRELERLTRLLEDLVGDALRDADADKENTSGADTKQFHIAEDIKAKLLPPLSASPHHNAHRYQSLRFYLVKKQSKSTGARQAAVSKPSDVVHIQEEIARLSAIRDGLERELSELRARHRSRIDDLSSVLPDAVCIPPMDRER